MLKVSNVLSFVPIFLVVIFQGCTPFEVAEELTASSQSELSFLKCSTRDLRNPNASELKRLSKFEIENTIHDILASYLNTPQVTSVMSQIQSLIDDIPSDHIHEGMNIADQSVTMEHIDKQILVAEKLAEVITSNTVLMESLVGSCRPIGTAECVGQFLDHFGKKAYRRPLSAEDKQWYLSVFNGHSDGYRNLIAALLSSPRFIYHIEVGDAYLDSDSDKKVVRLSSYEIASKLSYFLLQSLPDDALMQAAEKGYLASTAGIKKQVDRLLKLPLARQRLAKSIANQWLNLDATPEWRSDLASVSSMLASLNTQENLNLRRQHLINETYDYLYYMIWEKQATYKEVMTADIVFPRTADLAEIYGTKVWNGSFGESDLVRAPAGERAGVLTLAQRLFTGTSSTRPIMRGVDVYRNFLCGKLPTPADNNPPEGIMFEDDFSGRESVIAMTEVKGTSCVGCHQNVINPLSFPFETYDSFGRWRSQENIYHPDTSENKGQILAVKPVNSWTTVNLTGRIEGDIPDAVRLAHRLSKSPVAQTCFDMKLWSFTLKQNISFGENDCALGSLNAAMRTGNGTIYETLQAIPLQPEFLKRTIH